MERHVFPIIGDTPITEIDRRAVLDALKPIWFDLPDAARRVRGRIGRTLDYAVDLGLVEVNSERLISKVALPPQPKGVAARRGSGGAGLCAGIARLGRNETLLRMDGVDRQPPAGSVVGTVERDSRRRVDGASGQNQGAARTPATAVRPSVRHSAAGAGTTPGQRR